MPAPSPTTSFERLGGADGVHAIVTDFVARLVKDPMVGFFFARVREERLVELEYAYAAEHLGGPVTYTGRPLQQAHRRFGIGAGHFARRRLLLAEVLSAHGAPLADARAWIAHQDANAPLVVQRGPKASCPVP